MSNTDVYIPYFRDENLWLDYRLGIAGNSFTWNWERPATDVQYLAVHHSVTNIRSTWKGEEGAKKYADEIANFHIDARGWGGIGYHFIVCPDGYLVYVGDAGTARANVAEFNEKVIGICMIGDFTKHLPTDEQITSMHELTWWFDRNRASWKNLKPTWEEMVKGHKELNVIAGVGATACPGSSYPVDMKERIKNNVVYTPQPPEPELPPTDPPTAPDPEPPTDPDDCCALNATQIELLKDRVAKLERQTIWDILKRR